MLALKNMIQIMSNKNQVSLAMKNTPTELAAFDPALKEKAKALCRSAGQTLFRAGTRPRWLFFVVQGHVELERVTVNGAPVILQRTSRGFLAEASLTAAQYHCDGVCRSPCDLLAFPLQALRDGINQHEPTRWAWIELLSAQSRRQRLRIERIALHALRDRLRHLIFSEGQPDGSYTLTGTRAVLAAELGVTPAALYRTLAHLSAEGVLSLDRSVLRWHG